MSIGLNRFKASGDAVDDYLSTADIEQRIALASGTDVVEDVVVPAMSEYRYIRPLGDAADNLIEVFSNDVGRYQWGLREIDLMMRGVGPSELCFVTGRSHSGKTQLCLTSLLHNTDKPVILFTFDETAELVLTKLTCLKLGVDAEQLEKWIRRGDPEAKEAVRHVASRDFPKLIVLDGSLGFEQMGRAVDEAQQWFGEPISAVMIDYLELIPGDDIDVSRKAQALKRWTKDIALPVICLHQGSRTGSPSGQRPGMDGMRYGGENEANFVVSVWRKRDDKTLDEWERSAHTDTVSVAVEKNKRPPSKKGEATYFMDPKTGMIRPIVEDDKGAYTSSVQAGAEADF